MCAPENPREKIHRHLKKAEEEVKEAADTAREVGDTPGAKDLDGVSQTIKTRTDKFGPQSREL